MRYKPLGDTGVQIPEVGFGTWLYKGDGAVIRRTLELDGPFIDTAESYRTENYVGQAIRGQREAYFIATKVSPENHRAADLVRSCDRSLARLGIDVIDLYQLHAPSPSIPIEETMEGMARVIREGKVRFAGVSNFSVEQMKAADAALRDLSGGHRVVANQVLYSVFARGIEADLLPYCEENRVTVIGYSPLAQGRLGGELKNRPELSAALERAAAETGKTVAQALINWAVRSPWAVTIPATNRVERVDENYAASDWRLTDAQYAAISAAA